MTKITSNGADFLARDRAHLLHPLHSTKLHQQAKVWVSGQGAILTHADGNTFIDGLAGLWNVTEGHVNQELVEAMHKQAGQ